MIEFDHIYKSFGEIAALKDVSFQARDGLVTGVLGPNGAGKTTSLRILYTVLKPDRGVASVDGYDTIQNTLEVQRRIGALPDSHGLYPRLTARENIRYYGRLHGMQGATLDDQIERLVQMLEMQDFSDRKTEGFSSGQRIKVAIARALVHDPRNILLDEPTNGLDVMSTRAMRAFIRRLRDDGRCVLLSSHIMQEVSALCDHIVIINRGEVAVAGSPDEIQKHTGQANLEDAFVAAIGTDEGLVRA
jgi:sodium transport system ATP-binding protein